MPATVLQFKPRENDEVSESGQYLGTMPTVSDVERMRAEGEAIFNARAINPTVAVIVAELHVDMSEPVTDYFNSRAVKTLVLAFSSHGRDSFPEMRKAAANAPETQHLVNASKEAEHREKYSFGRGYYLTEDSYSGWQIKKWDLEYKRNEIFEILSEGGLRAPMANVKTSQLSGSKSEAAKKAWATRQLRKAAK